MPTQTSLAVAQGATVRYTDHNKLVTDVGAIIAEKGAASGLASLNSSSKVAQGPADGTVVTAALVANSVTQAVTSALGTASFTTTSMTYVDVTGISASITTVAGSILAIDFNLPNCWHSNSNNRCIVGVNIDGTDYVVGSPSNGGTTPARINKRMLFNLSAGTHTVKLRLANGFTDNTSAIDRISTALGDEPYFFTLTEFKR